MKFGFPMAFTITTVAWGLVEFTDAYQQSGEFDRALQMIKWGTDYFINAHPSKYEFYAQVSKFYELIVDTNIIIFIQLL